MCRRGQVLPFAPSEQPDKRKDQPTHEFEAAANLTKVAGIGGAHGKPAPQFSVGKCPLSGVQNVPAGAAAPTRPRLLHSNRRPSMHRLQDNRARSDCE